MPLLHFLLSNEQTKKSNKNSELNKKLAAKSDEISAMTKENAKLQMSRDADIIAKQKFLIDIASKQIEQSEEIAKLGKELAVSQSERDFQIIEKQKILVAIADSQTKKSEEIAQLNKELAESQKELSQLNKEISKNFTGGESYCYIDMRYSLTQKGIVVSLIHEGTHTLHDLEISVLNTDYLEEKAPVGNSILIGSMNPETYQTDLELVRLYPNQRKYLYLIPFNFQWFVKD